MSLSDILHDEVDRLETYRDAAHTMVEAAKEVMRGYLLSTPSDEMEALVAHVTSALIATGWEVENGLADLTTKAFQESAASAQKRREASRAA